MSSYLEQLENNEAILLMYLTEELPTEDRAQVEQMLARDAGLRAELEQIRALYAGAMGRLDELEAAHESGVSQATSLRNVSRLMKQWQVNRLVSAPLQMPRKTRHVGMWMIPASVAAAAILVIGWWAMQPQTHTTTENNLLAAASDESVLVSPALQPEDHHLNDAERQLLALAGASNEIPSMFPSE
jgi:anti-sigma factor RsiW